MKKISYVLLAILILSFCLGAYAEETEIQFHNIPWLTNEATVQKKLKDYQNLGLKPSKGPGEIGIIIKNDKELHGRPSTTGEYADQCTSISYSGKNKGKIAGYKINQLLLTFAKQDANNMLICVKVDLAGASYSDLMAKLSKVYGEGETGIDEEGLQTVIWRGKDQSCVLLYTVDEGATTDLIYGRLDAEAILKGDDSELPVNADPDDVSGL